jgi:hypothetical protein
VVDVEHLRSASEEELMRLHNEEMKHRASHYNVYLDELTRRETIRQGKRMEALTTSLNRLTWAIAIATFIGVAIAAATFLAGA